MTQTPKTHKLVMTFRTGNGRRKEESFPVTAEETKGGLPQADAISRATTVGFVRGWTMVNHRFEAA